MTLTELKYIVAVAREKHFGKAAEACFVSQPTLSVAIKKLEDELEVKLFERSANEVSVTPLGEEIVRQAQSVLEQAAAIKEIAKRGKDPLAGPLKLGVIYTIGPYLLPKLIPILRKTAPAMQLLIQENFTHVLGEELKSGRVDVILVALPFEEPGIVTRPVSGKGSAMIAQSISPVRSISSSFTVKFSCSISGICGVRAIACRTRSGSR